MQTRTPHMFHAPRPLQFVSHPLQEHCATRIAVVAPLLTDSNLVFVRRLIIVVRTASALHSCQSEKYTAQFLVFGIKLSLKSLDACGTGSQIGDLTVCRLQSLEQWDIS